MESSAKRLYTAINQIRIENGKGGNSKKFIVDQTPFDDEDSDEVPKPLTDGKIQYFLVVGRILPTSNIYNRSAFKTELKVPVEYPFNPPQVELKTPIYHPNVGPEGKICLPMLQPQVKWLPTNTLVEVINAVLDYIDNPDIDKSVSPDIAAEYQNNRTEFDRKVAELIQRNMVPRQ